MEKLKGERWRVVTDDYYVSTHGRLRRGKGPKARLMKTWMNSRGYHCVTIKGVVNTTLANLILRTFKAQPYQGAPVRYKDGDRGNCQLSNLTWKVGFGGTPS